MNKFMCNQEVDTPNGRGIVQGINSSGSSTIYSYGRQLYIVRHKISEMKSKESGECLTPKAVLTGLWLYEANQLKAVQ